MKHHRRGRPPLDNDDPSVPLKLTMPSRQLAAATAKANKERITVQEWIRRRVREAATADTHPRVVVSPPEKKPQK